MEQAILPVVGLCIVVVVAVLIVFALSRVNKLKTDRATFLAQNGFVSCDDHEQYLQEMSHLLSGDVPNNLQDYVASQAMVNRSSGEDVFYFWLQRRRSSENDENGEFFLFPFQRKSEEPVTVYLSPKAVPAGMEKFLGNMIAAFTPGNMKRLELPPELKGGKILAMIGPPGASPYDLLDSSTISNLLAGAEQGLGCFMARSGFALAGLETKFSKPELSTVWQFVQRLAKSR
jgi:hypothetical protein